MEERGPLGKENPAVFHLHNRIDSTAFLATLLGILCNECSSCHFTDIKSTDSPRPVPFLNQTHHYSVPHLHFPFFFSVLNLNYSGYTKDSHYQYIILNSICFQSIRPALRALRTQKTDGGKSHKPALTAEQHRPAACPGASGSLADPPFRSCSLMV